MTKSDDNNWKLSRLSELGVLGRGKSKHRPRNDASLFGGIYPFIQTSDIKHSNYYVNSYTETYNEFGLAQSKLWQKDTLCMTIAANIAETALLSFPACFPDSVVGFVADPLKSDVRFIKYSLDYYKKDFQNTAKGTAQDNLSLEKIDNLQMNVPSVKVQSKIASVLSTYDLLVENNEKRIKILEEMGQRLFTEWFVKFKFPNHENTKKIESGTEHGIIPYGWDLRRLTDLVYINPPTKITNKHQVLHVPMECLSTIRSFIDLDKTFRKDGGSGIKFINGDTLFARITPCLQNGKGAFVNFLENEEVGCGSTEFVVMRSKVLSATYIYFLSRDPNFRKTAELTMAGASGRQRVRSEFFQSYLIPTPESHLLDKFETLTKNMFETIKVLSLANRSLTQIRDLLIPQLVTGKVEVKE